MELSAVMTGLEQPPAKYPDSLANNIEKRDLLQPPRLRLHCEKAHARIRQLPGLPIELDLAREIELQQRAVWELVNLFSSHCCFDPSRRSDAKLATSTADFIAFGARPHTIATTGIHSGSLPADFSFSRHNPLFGHAGHRQSNCSRATAWMNLASNIS